LPSSQQEEYRRLKQQIVELEEQRKRWQQQQKSLPKNMTYTKLSSLSSSPNPTAVVKGSVKPPLKIVLTNTSAEKKEVKQSTHTSTKVGSDSRKIFRTSHSTYIQGNVEVKEAMQQYSATHAQESKEMKTSDGPFLTTVAPNVTQTALIEIPSHLIVSADAFLQKSGENVSRTVCTAASVVKMSKEQQGGTLGKTKKLGNIIRKEEESVMEAKEYTSVKDGLHEVHNVHQLSACKSDGLPSKGIACDESLEDKEAKLAQAEHQLLSKR
jgi:hypothetical protein